MCGSTVIENDDTCTNEFVSAQSMSGKNGKAIKQLCWLNKIKKSNVAEVQRTKENRRRSSSKKGVEKRNYSDHGKEEEVSVRAAQRVFCKVTSKLHNARNRSSILFFNEIADYLSPWNLSSCPELREMSQPNLFSVYLGQM